MEDVRGFFMILGLVLRILGIIVCSNKAKELNRNSRGWGIFGFFMPIIAMIWIQFMKPIMKWDKNIDINTSSSDGSSDQNKINEWKQKNPNKSLNDYFVELRKNE